MDQTYSEATPPPAPEAARLAKAPEERPGKRPQEPPSEQQQQQQLDDMPEVLGTPAVMHVDTMTKYEKDKVKRIVTPKATTGRLEVPQDVFELWQTSKGKEKLLSMWCKSGGVKDRCVADSMLIELMYIKLKDDCSLPHVHAGYLHAAR